MTDEEPTFIGDLIAADIRRQAMIDQHGEPPEQFRDAVELVAIHVLQRLADMVVDPAGRRAFSNGWIELVVRPEPPNVEWRNVDAS